jgi:hypothetical protein
VIALVAALLCATPHAWSGLDAPARTKVIESLAREPIGNRLADTSARFLGTPYVLSPLGEGQGRDPDPLVRFDAVDCLTFVEETIALSLAETDARVVPVLTQIRYGATPAYENRNHLMEAEWIPSNEAKGFLREVTAVYGGPDVVRTEKVIKRAAWKSKLARELALPKSRQVTGRYPITMLPLDKLEAHAAAIPTGTIFVVVREDSPYRVTRMTHLGFVVQKRRGTFLRHASSAPSHRVVDEPLDHFLARNARYPWKVDGVSLFEVVSRKNAIAHATP